MTDLEKKELDRWLKRIGGEVNTWTTKDGVTHYEARAWKDGKVLRFINTSRYQPISALKSAWVDDKPPEKKPKARCSSCPQDAAEEFKIRCSDIAAARAGIVLTGPWVDTSAEGFHIHEETVRLCQRCLAKSVQWFLLLMRDPETWLKLVRVP